MHMFHYTQFSVSVFVYYTVYQGLGGLMKCYHEEKLPPPLPNLHVNACKTHQRCVKNRKCKCRESRQREGTWKERNRWTMDRTMLPQQKEDLSTHVDFFQCEDNMIREKMEVRVIWRHWQRKRCWERDGWEEDEVKMMDERELEPAAQNKLLRWPMMHSVSPEAERGWRG